MPTLAELGQKVKTKYPGAYDDIPDVDLGRKIQQKYPGAYDDFTETSAVPPQSAASVPATKPPDPIIAEVQEFMDAPLRPGSQAGKAAAGMLVSGALTTGGTALGGAVAGPPGAVVGGLAGSYAGRKANVALGLEEPGLAGDIASVAVPGVMQGAQALKPALVKRLPGAAAALHEEAAQTVQQIPEVLTPAVPSADLYKQLAQVNPPIRPNALWATSSKILQAENRLQPSLQNPTLRNVAEDLHALALQHGGNIPLQDLRAHQQRLGELLQAARRAGGPELGAYKQLYKAFYDDFERAAARGVPGADLVKQANAAARQEFAKEEVAELFLPGKGINTRPDGLIQINGGRLSDAFERKLKTDELFAGSFTKDQLTEIRDIFKQAMKVPRIPPPKGQSYGSAMAVGRGGLVSGLTLAVTGDPILATIAGGAAAGAPHYLGQALMTDAGRAWLKRQLAERGAIDPATLGAVTSGVRQMVTGTEEESK